MNRTGRKHSGGRSGPARLVALGFAIVVLAIVIPVVLAGLPPRPLSGGEHIIIDKSSNRLYLYSGHTLVKTYRVATGKTRTATPEGRFVIGQKAQYPQGFEHDPDIFGTRWMGLRSPGGGEDLKYGIHGTDRPESIGTHASKGCIRLENSDIDDLYERVESGTPVYIIERSIPARFLRDLINPPPQ